MIQFYSHFIHPISPARSKLVVHLVAQTPAPEATSTVSNIVEKTKSLVIGEEKETQTVEEEKKAEVKGNGIERVVITDVRKFKAGLLVSAGPRPVKDISEFEELDAKL